MHRAVCRALRGSCRKWRESECPIVAGEDATNNKWKNQEFVPPKHTWNEALGWTTGLVLAWQVSHRKWSLGEDSAPFSALNRNALKKCPFGVSTTNAVSQPLVSTVSSVVDHKPKGRRRYRSISIDSTPFLKEDLSLFDSSVGFSQEFSENDCEIIFEEEKPTTLNILKASVPLQAKKFDEKETAERGNIDQIVSRFSGDLYSVLGAFTFLHKAPKENSQNQNEVSKTSGAVGEETPSKCLSANPPIHAMELLNKGAELGSSRALYNIGVAYDRMKEPKLAREYYRKAADLGHPLAAYNSSIFYLQDGNFAEGLTLMRIAAEKGVPEAKKVLKDVDV